MKKQLIFGHVLTLFIGGLIYILFRSVSLKMFKWFEIIGLSNIANELRNYTAEYLDEIPNWILFSLPDGLWVFSYVSLLLLVWQNSLSENSLFWILIIPFLALGSEGGQLIGVIPGTFDGYDLLFYSIGMIAPFVIYKDSINLNFQST